MLKVTLYQSFALLFQSAEVLYYWFQKKLEMKYVTIATTFALTITAVWRILLLASSATVEWFALSGSVSAFISSITIVYFFSRDRVSLNVSLTDTKFLLGTGYHYMISGLAVTVYTQIDRIMLGNFSGPQEVGYYSAAMTLAVMWQFIPQAMINSSRPLLIMKHSENNDRFIHSFQKLLLIVTLLGVGVSICFQIFGGICINILFGEGYVPAKPMLSVLIWSTSFAMIGVARSIWISAEKLNKYPKYMTVLGAIFELCS